jgi:histidine triad (HIT) family protein
MANQDADCIFCRIAAGRIPCHKVYEDDRVLAFLDIMPLSAGHVLIIPKAHSVTVDGMTDEDSAACGRVIPRLSRAVMKATGCKAYNVLQNNGRAAHQAVDHVHFHIIPKTPTGGLGVEWPAGKLDAAEGAKLVAAIRDAMPQ